MIKRLHGSNLKGPRFGKKEAGSFLRAIETIEEKWVNFQNDKMI